MIRPGDTVLDIGGWACPFNRATHVMDAMPYSSRGFYARRYPTGGWKASQGGDTQCFTEATWIVRDLCDKTPFPFADKSVDVVICSHTLEDIRDPVFVVQEMQRIGKRGYIEVPSRELETCRGIDDPNVVGFAHHRWLIETRGSHLAFRHKSHLIHSHWRYSLPTSHRAQMPAERTVTCLFWDGTVTAEEVFELVDDARPELERYVASVRPYAPVRLTASKWSAKAQSFVRRATGRLRRDIARLRAGS
jgi:hypothetical protein